MDKRRTNEGDFSGFTMPKSCLQKWSRNTGFRSLLVKPQVVNWKTGGKKKRLKEIEWWLFFFYYSLFLKVLHFSPDAWITYKAWITHSGFHTDCAHLGNCGWLWCKYSLISMKMVLPFCFPLRYWQESDREDAWIMYFIRQIYWNWRWEYLLYIVLYSPDGGYLLQSVCLIYEGYHLSV